MTDKYAASPLSKRLHEQSGNAIPFVTRKARTGKQGVAGDEAFLRPV